MKARFVFENGKEEIRELSLKKGEVGEVSIAREDVPEGVDYIDFAFDFLSAKAGDKGYFITDRGSSGTVLTRFVKRSDYQVVTDVALMPCFGFKKEQGGILAVVTGMRCDIGTVLGVKDGVYYTYPRFFLDGDEPYEDITVRYYYLKNGNYSEMARTYRDYQLSEGGCIPLRDRIKKDARLQKAADAIEVRVRQGWKPAPSPVEYQTPETEPPMHVACTFDRVGNIADEFKRSGIDNAEFCLVGWNYGGHDGRFPQILPVDPRLGGEERLRSLIKKVKSLDYSIVCHDDATAAYTIADCFDEEYLLRNKDGNFHLRPYCWSGGRPHKVCPQRQYERFEVSNQEILKGLGFEGIHYIDVITILPMLKCYSNDHPLNRKASAGWYEKIMQLARTNFGGFASEGSFDFAAKYVDYILYAAFGIGSESTIPLCDQIVPLWAMTYHGIILYNPCTYTLNYAAKDIDNRLKFFELGGRPLVCYYANFALDSNWMGKEDFLCDTDEQLKDSVEKIKIMRDDYDLLKPERYEFIEEHQEVSHGVFKTVYSNKTEVVVDYNKKTFEISRSNEAE